MIEPSGPESPRKTHEARGRAVTRRALFASMLVAAVVGGAVAAGVTLGTMRLQSRTNPQEVGLTTGVTIKEEDATNAVAQKAAPAIVSIVTQESSLSHGSGFLVTSDGYIVSNVAVIANAKSLAVLLSGDPKRHDVRPVDYDCTTGVAVLKMDQVSNLPTLAFDNGASLQLGQFVIVRGGTWNDPHVVTRGVISALHSMVTVAAPFGGTPERQMSNVIQTDAQIDPGVSGAPLLNVGGHVIGVTMAGSSHGQPVGFALPSSDLEQEVEQIIQAGSLVVASLGAQTLDVSADTAAVRGGVPGAQITSLDSGGPAERAGLKTGDVITQLDDQKLDDAHPLAPLLRTRFKPDQRVTVSYARSGSSGQVQLTLLGEHPSCR
ncbi:MAG TPA: trypsin-like peptidase domain-containing protein [Candidatus Dormibacteraeota bacterium]|nr:trypsin-like peptidase domain-containing protein [Candidatus Dormibacteraeota bacterium]